MAKNLGRIELVGKGNARVAPADPDNTPDGVELIAYEVDGRSLDRKLVAFDQSPLLGKVAELDPLRATAVFERSRQQHLRTARLAILAVGTLVHARQDKPPR